MRYVWICQLLTVSCVAASRLVPDKTADWFASHSVENVRHRKLHQDDIAPYENLPRWSEGSRGEWGPVSPGFLVLDGSQTGGCLTIGEILEQIPDASRFFNLLTYSGLKNQLLDDPKVMATVIVPTDDAFAAPLGSSAEPNEYGANMSVLIENRPDVISSLIGASIWKGLYPSSTLQSGTSIPTSNSIGGMGAPPLEVQIARDRDDISIEAQGSTAKIIARDIAGCGPSVIHIVDTILLPFSFDDQPKDRLNPQNPVVQAGLDAQSKLAEEQISNVDFNWRDFFG